jgi:hypothetical protein
MFINCKFLENKIKYKKFVFFLKNVAPTKVYSKVVGGPVLHSNSQIISNSHVTTDNNSKTTSQRYKTELCRSYHETGLCKYGEKCQFAHGYHEIRSLNRHPKYKTILCRTYHCTGYCKTFYNQNSILTSFFLRSVWSTMSFFT